MNIAIVDDSKNDNARLFGEIERYAAQCSLEINMKEYSSGEHFLDQIELNPVEVVFLDIYMGKLNGMEVAQEIRKRNIDCHIIFVTTSVGHAVGSYDVSALHYILKPYESADIDNVMQKIEKSNHKTSRYIKVKEGREWRKVMLDSVLYVDYSNHYIQLHLGGEVISTYMKFSEIEAKLLVYKEFLSCYRCIIVNMNKIKKAEELFFMLDNGEFIPINRKRVKEIKQVYLDYIFGLVEEHEV